MKTVQIMKKAIKDSDLKGYKWTADRKGLHWSYGVDFKFSTDNICGDKEYKFEDENSGVHACVYVVKENDYWLCDEYNDFVKTAEEAVYWAARKIIVKANSLY